MLTTMLSLFISTTTMSYASPPSAPPVSPGDLAPGLHSAILYIATEQKLKHDARAKFNGDN